MLFFRSHWNSKYFSSKTEQRFLWPLLQIIIPCDRVLKLWLAIFDALLALTMARLQILANFFERITFRRTDNWFLWTDNFWFTPFKSMFYAKIRQKNIEYIWSRGMFSDQKKKRYQKLLWGSIQGPSKLVCWKLYLLIFFTILVKRLASSNLYLTLDKLAKVTDQSY